MVFSGSGAQPSGAYRLVQASIVPSRATRALAGVAALALLSGCSSTSSMNPVNWWHDLQGGKIAEQRPAPPGADDPDPNLASVPARPAPPDRDAMKNLTESLVGDRTNAQYTAEAAPLADPSSRTASPNLFGAGTLPPPPAAPPPNEAPLSASLPAASAPPPPPAPAAPPSPAPRRPVESQPLEAPVASEPVVSEPMAPAAAPPAAETMTAPPTAPSAAPPEAPPALAPAADTTPLPELPTAPPPRAAAAPTPPPAPPAPIAPAPAPAGTVTVNFQPGSSTLSPTGSEEVKRFLTGRVGQPIVVTGYGDATSADPGSQAAAVALALTRGQAVVNALTAAGVPRTAITLGAEAAGRGASLRMLQ